MDLNELHQKLIATARANPPSERVPYAFEKRILERLASAPVLDEWALLARGLWRAMAPCLAVMLLLGAWVLIEPALGGASTDLSQDFENTLLVVADQDGATDSFW